MTSRENDLLGQSSEVEISSLHTGNIVMFYLKTRKTTLLLAAVLKTGNNKIIQA